MERLSAIQFLALVALLRCPMSAYAVKQEVTQFTRRQFRPPKNTLKYSLKALAKAGLIEDCYSESYAWVSTRQLGTVYELTEAGRRRLERELIMHLDVLDTAKLWLQQYEAVKAKPDLPYYRPSRFARMSLPRDLADL